MKNGSSSYLPKAWSIIFATGDCRFILPLLLLPASSRDPAIDNFHHKRTHLGFFVKSPPEFSSNVVTSAYVVVVRSQCWHGFKNGGFWKRKLRSAKLIQFWEKVFVLDFSWSNSFYSGTRLLEFNVKFHPVFFTNSSKNVWIISRWNCCPVGPKCFPELRNIQIFNPWTLFQWFSRVFHGCDFSHFLPSWLAFWHLDRCRNSWQEEWARSRGSITSLNSILC